MQPWKNCFLIFDYFDWRNIFWNLFNFYKNLNIFRLFYEHSGDETLLDRIYFFAESLYRRDTRIEFWINVNIIAENDNPPYLNSASSLYVDESELDSNEHVIYLIEDSERVLYPSLLPWVDSDHLSFNKPSTSLNTSDSWTNGVLSKIPEIFSLNKVSSASTSVQLLNFHFMELFRDFIICTTDFPELSVRNFTQHDLSNGTLIIRHLNVKKNINTIRFILCKILIIF